MIRALIVDDEPWARKRIASLLAGEADVEVVGQCASGEEAIAQIGALTPDLVFLDVQMPGVDGFDVLEAVGPERMPLVIFATAWDQYAVRAFDAQAVDYLLKPFDEDRFQRALQRARRELAQERPSPAVLQTLLDAVRGQRPYLQRLVVNTQGRVVFLKSDDVDWFEAAGNYVTLHSGAESYLLRGTLVSLESKLDPQQFARVHRSAIVNLDRVREVQPWFNGERRLVLKDGTEMTVGRAYRSRLTG